ncbi:MAG: YncE family protein [Gemmatimonadales bacterium]
MRAVEGLVIAVLVILCSGCSGKLSGGKLQDQDSLVLRYHASVGAEEGPLAFGQIGPLAANDSLLAIADRQACDITFYDTRKELFVNRVGGCGNGPAEFDRVGGMVWHGDSLFVLEFTRRQIVVIDVAGEELRRMRVDTGPYALMMQHIAFVNDTSLLISLGLMSSVRVSADMGDTAHLFLALVDARTGKLRRRFYKDPDPISLRNQASYLRLLVACAPGGARRGTIATLSGWAFRGEIFDVADIHHSVRYTTPIKGHKPVKVAPGAWFQFGYPSIGCGRDVVLIKWIEPERSETSRRGVGGHLEVRDYDGKLLMQRNLTRADSAMFGSTRAAIGNRFFFVLNGMLGFPVVSEYRLERNGRN